jgi:phosphate transport system substrate-binding protein
MKKVTKNYGKAMALFSGVIIAATIFSGCLGEGDATTVVVKGSSTVLPIADRCAEVFNEMHDDIKVTVAGGGSSLGIESVATGKADIGDASREIKSSEIEKYGNIFNEYAVAKDGVAVIVSKEIYNAGVTDLTLQQIKEIYGGTINNWQDVGGPNEEIFVNERDEGSGTRDTFMDIIDLETANGADKANSANSQVTQAVSGSKVAIGYVGLGYVNPQAPAVKINGVEPSPSTIKNDLYPISRSLYMYTKGEPTGAVKEFLEFVLSQEGQNIVEQEGFISVI